MRSFIRAAVAALVPLAVVATGAAAQAGPKLAYLNSNQVLAQAPGRAEAEALFQKEVQDYRAQVARMSDSLQAMIADYNKAAATLSPTAKETREKAIQAKEEEYGRRSQQLEQSVQQRQEQLIRPIMERINKVIEDMRKAEGYAFVFDVGSQANTIVAADPALDITNRVIQRLKEMGPVAQTPAAAPARPQSSTPPAGQTKTPQR